MEEDEEEEDELELARESSSDIPIYERETNIHFNEKNVKHEHEYNSVSTRRFCFAVTMQWGVTMYECNQVFRRGFDL